MKRARAILAFVLALFLMSLFCSCEAMREAALKAGEKPTEDALNSQSPSAVYDNSSTPGAAYDHGAMALSDEEMAEILALFGVEGCNPEDYGTLEFLIVNLTPNESIMNLTYTMDKPYEEVEAALTDQIKGEWKTGSDGADIAILKDSSSVLCSLRKNDKEIWLSYMAGSEVPVLKAILDSHWPSVIIIPEELSGKPYKGTLSSMPDEGFATYMREWELSDEEEANRIFDWLRDSLKDVEPVFSDITDKEKNVMYSIQGVDVWITCENDTLSISCDSAL